MAVLESHDASADDPVGTALRKIMRALPEAVAAQAELVRRTARPVIDRRSAPPEAAITAQLVHACAQRRQVELDYRTETGQWLTRVEPWAVVVRQGRWYLLCRRTDSGAIRTYRIDRVHAVTELADGFEPPSDLDPVATLEENFAVGWEHRVEVVFEAPVAELTWLSAAIGRLEPIDAQHCRLLGSTSDPEWYAEVLAGIPFRFQVVGSEPVRDAVRRLGERLLAAGQP